MNDKRNYKRRKKHYWKCDKTGMSFEFTQKKDGTIVCVVPLDWHPDYKHPERSFFKGQRL